MKMLKVLSFMLMMMVLSGVFVMVVVFSMMLVFVTAVMPCITLDWLASKSQDRKSGNEQTTRYAHFDLFPLPCALIKR